MFSLSFSLVSRLHYVMMNVQARLQLEQCECWPAGAVEDGQYRAAGSSVSAPQGPVHVMGKRCMRWTKCKAINLLSSSTHMWSWPLAIHQNNKTGFKWLKCVSSMGRFGTRWHLISWRKWMNGWCVLPPSVSKRLINKRVVQGGHIFLLV